MQLIKRLTESDLGEKLVGEALRYSPTLFKKGVQNKN